jgi:hypothetical protein
MQTSRKFLVAFYLLLAIGLIAVVPTLTLGQDASDNSTVTVTIQQLTEITVSPDSLSWSLAPCDVGTQRFVDITNTGSKSVNLIHAYVDTLDNETSKPTGVTASEYAASGIIMIQNQTNSSWHYAGRIEWNSTTDIANKDVSAVDSCVNPALSGNCSYGFIKNTTFDYMWAIGNGSNSKCNETGAQLAIETDDDDGTASTRTPLTSVVQGSVLNQPGWGFFTVEHPLLSQSCVAVHWNCTYIYMYKYDRRSTDPNDFTNCAASSDVQVGNLAPDITHTLTVNAFAPCGIAQGALAESNLYIEATEVP